ncbi:MAG: efflux RND transporter periplasmic adaptor subunit [Polyangiales bacterium]
MIACARNVFVLTLALGCNAPAPPALREEPAVAARWVRAVASSRGIAWEAPGVVRAEGQGAGELTAPVRVRVRRVLVQPGDRVRAGDPLAEVEAPDVLRALGTRDAAAARGAPLRAWRDELAAQRDAGLVRSSELRDVQARLGEAEAERIRAESDVRASGFAPADLRALARAGRTLLRAPLEGVVQRVEMIPGRVVDPGGAALAVIVAPRPVRVEVRLHDAWPAGPRCASSPPTARPWTSTPRPSPRPWTPRPARGCCGSARKGRPRCSRAPPGAWCSAARRATP